MKIRTFIKADYKIVEVVGPLQRAYEKEVLLALSQPLVQQVFFKGVFALSEKIIRKLVQIQQEHILRIQSDEIALSMYLNKLQLRTIHVPGDNRLCRMNTPSQIRMLILAGSADSTDKIREIVRVLPFVPTLSVCIVQHIPRGGKLGEDIYWRQYTDYKVRYAGEGMEVAGGVIYLAKPDHHLRIKDGIFRLGQDEEICYARPSIDVTLTSLADEYGAAALALMLCGYGSDGVDGSGYAVSNNMWLMLENAGECDAFELLNNIKSHGKYHAQVTLEQMNYLVLLFASPEEELLAEYLKIVADYCGYNFGNYIIESIERRVDAAVAKYTYLNRRGLFIGTIMNKQRFIRLLQDLSVPTTHFFREPTTWRYIKDEILPTLTREQHIKIWSAGASTGKEAYSMAMLAQHEDILHKCLIYGTDISDYSIEIAKNGLYPLSEIDEFRNNLRDGVGDADIRNYLHAEENFFSVDSMLSSQVFFFQHNLAMEGSMNMFHLILCNNVLIYFNDYLRDSVLELIKNSLFPGGYLVIGKNENIVGMQQEKYFSQTGKANVYQKIRR